MTLRFSLHTPSEGGAHYLSRSSAYPHLHGRQGVCLARRSVCQRDNEHGNGCAQGVWRERSVLVHLSRARDPQSLSAHDCKEVYAHQLIQTLEPEGSLQRGI